MELFVSKIRVGYSDTDQMGFVHHSNYLKYYETARWDFFSYLGIPYKKIESVGYMLPVVKAEIKFLKPAFYDDIIVIETSILGFRGCKLALNFRLFNEAGDLINTASVVVAFMNEATHKACRPPQNISAILQKITSKKAVAF